MKNLTPPPATYIRTMWWTVIGAPVLLAFGGVVYRASAAAGIALMIAAVLLFAGGLMAQRWGRKRSPAEVAFRIELRDWLLTNYNLQASEKVLDTLSHSMDDMKYGRNYDAIFQSHSIDVRIDETLRLSSAGRKVAVCLKVETSGETALVLTRIRLQGAGGMSQPVFAARHLLRL